MKNLIKSLALVGVLTVIGSAHSTELIANGTFTANASSFVSYNGVIGTQWGNPASITSWSTAPVSGGTSWWGLEGAGTSAGTALGPANTGGRTYSFSYWSGGTTWLYQFITTFTANTLYRISYNVACSQVSSANYGVGVYGTIPGTPVYYNGSGTVNNSQFTSVTNYFISPASLGTQPLIYLYNQTAGAYVDYANVSIQNTTPNAPSFSNNGPVCQGGTVTLYFSSEWCGAFGSPTVTFTINGPALSNYQITGCSGSVSFSGALPGWSGTYTCTATVNGVTSAAASTVVTVNPSVSGPSTTGASRCGSGVVTLSASGSGGTLKWYSDAGLTVLVNTGASYSPTLSSTTTYYVTETSGGGCVSAASPVTGTVLTNPAAPTTTGASRCGSGAVTLSASGSGGTLKWYSDPGLTAQVNTGASYSPTLSGTTTYYVTETSGAGCVSLASPVTGTVIANPAAPSTTGASRCGSGVVTLSASGSGGTLKWYSDAGLTALVNTGGSYSPTLSGTTTYYVTETSGAGCVSLASPVTGTVKDIPSAPTAGNNGPVCPGATLSLTASTVSGATYAWTGPNGFTSSQQNPSIPSATTAATGTYYSTATVDGCTSAAGTTAATVGDTTPPTITCPVDVTVSANSGCTATNVALGSPVTGDNCSVATVVNNGLAAYPLGTNSVIWTVTDGSGNTATCMQQVIVRDTTPPTLIPPARIIIHL